jgi:membrane protein YqaA with SNARE-associated domain
MQDFLLSHFGVFLTWWGAFLLAFLDSSVFIFVPFGNDALVIYLAARHPDWFWWFPLVVTAGSTSGAAVTYWIGYKVGDAGLPKLVSKRKLERVRGRLENAGAVAIALPAALPPPFPLTAFILTAGALKVSRRRLLAVFAGTRLIRFGAEAYFARRYGDRVLAVLESDTATMIVAGLIVVAIVGTAVTIVSVWRGTRKADSAAV